MTDLENAVEILKSKNVSSQLKWEYYDGPQPLKYSTERLREMFKDYLVHFEMNWCSVVVDTLLDRITLKGLSTADKKANGILHEAWNRNGLQQDAFDAHQDALVTGEAYIIAWPDVENNLELYYNSSRMVHIFYDPDRPKRKQYAAKWWKDSTGCYNMTLYYPDRLEHYKTAKATSLPENAKVFKELGDAEPNKFGEIPVFPIRVGRHRAKSVFDKIQSNQDAVNKLFSDMMVAAEFGAFKQRYIISQADTEMLKNSPGVIWSIPASDGIGQQTVVGEFNETNLQGYLEAIDRQANFVAIVTKIPKHYFADAGTSGISGDALVALEAPLVKKVEQLATNFTSGWQELGAFILKVNNISTVPTDIKPVWESPKTIQPTAEANSRNVNVQAGIPLTTVLREEGWTDDELAQLKKDQDEANKRNSSLAKALLDKARDAAASMNEVKDAPAS